MAKARARGAARKVKDKWRAKNWYQIHAPTIFDEVVIAETLAEKPEMLHNRVTEVSLQNITNDFRKSHIKLYFKVNRVQDTDAHTLFEGHTLTSDYLRRMIRRRKSRIDGVYDVETRDGARLRVKPFAITDKRIQTSQKKIIRQTMKNTITNEGKAKTLNEFLRDVLDGKIGSEIYKACKTLYPVKRVEIFKTEMFRQPTIQIEEPKPKKEEKTPGDTKEKPPAKKTTKKLKEKKEESKEIPKESVEKPKTTKKIAKKKTPAKKTVKKTPEKKKTTKKTTTKKTTTKKTTKPKKKAKST
jgi:small subunit ribosomal protein S3Ae